MRVRLTFSKTGSLRYIGHLDLHQVWERTARRAGLPLAYTQGFHPGPRLQIACALPLGIAGLAEVVDLWLDLPAEPPLSPQAGAEWQQALQAAAPPGLALLSLAQVDERSPALQTQVAAAEYRLSLPPGITGLDAQVHSLLDAPSLPRERRGKPYDLRPLIFSLERRDESLHMRLSMREGATGRPEEVLRVLGIDPAEARIERTRLVLKDEMD